MHYSSDVIITKCAPHILRRELVVRESLLQKVLSKPLRKLTLISAAAGFGKSTLAASLYQRYQSQGNLVAWISLGADERKEILFLKYLLAALKRENALPTKEAETILESWRKNRIVGVMTALINEMVKHKEQIILFLDDYHLVDGEKIGFILEYLLNHAPTNFSIIISSRTRPKLPLSSLKAANELNEITDFNLRFTTKETRSFLQLTNELTLSDKVINRLQSKTEGWITGLQLVSLLLRKNCSEEELLKLVSGKFRDIMDYLAADVFSLQSEEIQNFLLKSSVLERMNNEVCNNLMDIDNSQVIFEELEDKNLFIIPLDAECGWYRYHHLFQHFLRVSLERQDHQLMKTLTTKASKWFLQYGSITEAVNYALKAGDYDLSASLIESHAQKYVMRGQMALLQDWLAQIPAHIVSDRHRIPMFLCMALFHMRQPMEASSAVLRAEDIVRRKTKSGLLEGDELEEIKAELMVLKTGVAIASDDVETARLLCQEFIENEPSKGNFNIGAMYNMYGYACYALSNFNQAREYLITARDHHQQAKSSYGIFYSDCFMGLNEVAMGHLHLAEALFLQAENIARDDGDPRSSSIPNAQLYRGCVLYEWNKISDAQQLIENNINSVLECGQAEAPIIGLCTLARIYFQQDDKDKAWQQLDLARKICQEDQLHRLMVLTDYEAIRHLLNENKLAQAIARAGLLSITMKEQDDDFMLTQWDREICIKHLIKIRLLIALKEHEHAIKLTDFVHELAVKVERPKRIMECLILKAITLWEAECREEATELFGQAIDIGRSEDYVRTFLDEGERINPILHALFKIRNSTTENKGYLHRLAVGMDNPQKDNLVHNHIELKTDNYLLLEALSQRELEVLSLLAVGKSNIQISQELSIKQNTVKWHIKNIFEKLGVNNRTSAVLAAQELKLVS